MALPRRAALVTIGTVLSGCASAPASDDDATEPASETASPTDVHTATEHGVLHCDRATIEKDLPEEATAVPDTLSEETVTEYVERLEEFVALPLTDGEPDGYVGIGDVTVEAVDYGYVATVPVTGGYYNQESDDSTETVHYDVAPYTATYFVSEQVVRRAEDDTVELDPREEGEVVACGST